MWVPSTDKRTNCRFTIGGKTLQPPSKLASLVITSSRVHHWDTKNYLPNRKQLKECLNLNWGRVTRNWGRWPSGCWALHGSSLTMVVRSRLLRREVQASHALRQGTPQIKARDMWGRVLWSSGHIFRTLHRTSSVSKRTWRSWHCVPLGLMGKGPVGHCYMFPFCT